MSKITENQMSKYTSPGMRAVTAESLQSAGQIFADRQARREFGRRGYARTCVMGSYAENMSFAEFNAFIGVDTSSAFIGGQRETSGRNINITVYAE